MTAKIMIVEDTYTIQEQIKNVLDKKSIKQWLSTALKKA